jgi:hypothetical protein
MRTDESLKRFKDKKAVKREKKAAPSVAKTEEAPIGHNAGYFAGL